MRPTSRITGVLLAAASLAAAAVPASAAEPAGQADRAAVGRAVRAFLSPAQAEHAALGAVRLSTADRRFAAARVRGPEVGDRVAVLARAGGGFRVLDVGTPSVGCGLLPAPALTDLGLGCPSATLVMVRSR